MPKSRSAKFRNKLVKYFNLDELKGIAFDLYINPETLRHQTLQELATSLMSYCARLNLIPRLLEICERERPHVSWPNLKSSDLQFLKSDDFLENSRTKNIDNSKTFKTEIGEMSGGTIFQGENIHLGPSTTADCPDCNATGLEHETCSKCGGSGRYSKYIGPTKENDDSKSSEGGFLKGLIDFATDIADLHSNTTNSRNYIQLECPKCDREGITLLTVDKAYVRRPCPTCKGTKKVSFDLNGNYSSAYSTIIVRRKDDFFLVKNIEVEIHIDSKLVGILKGGDLPIKVKNGTHIIQAKYPYSWVLSHSQKIPFSTKDDKTLKFFCSVDMPGMSTISVSLRLKNK